MCVSLEEFQEFRRVDADRNVAVTHWARMLGRSLEIAAISGLTGRKIGAIQSLELRGID